jgi:para-nitrobenzyl esterase
MLKRWLLFVLIASGVLPAASGAAAPVLTASGALSGLHERGLTVYRGVPFAAPPIGKLRWQSPAPVAPWIGTRAANAFGPACMQEGVSMPGETPPAMSEDCLYLNVWAPARGVAELLPVMVWIYGGGYRNGSASMPLYWAGSLIR